MDTLNQRTDAVSGEIGLELPALPEFVGTGRMVVASLARRNGFGDEQVEDLRVAVSEAITNAVRAHVDAGVDEPVAITVSMEGDALTVVVADRGSRPLEQPDPAHTPSLEDLERGLGLTLIRTLVPETTIESRAGGGTTLSMTLKREGSD